MPIPSPTRRAVHVANRPRRGIQTVQRPWCREIGRSQAGWGQYRRAEGCGTVNQRYTGHSGGDDGSAGCGERGDCGKSDCGGRPTPPTADEAQPGGGRGWARGAAGAGGNAAGTPSASTSHSHRAIFSARPQPSTFCARRRYGRWSGTQRAPSSGASIARTTTSARSRCTPRGSPRWPRAPTRTSGHDRAPTGE